MQPEEFHAKADELRRLAERAKDPGVRAELLLMAADWDGLAERERRAADQLPSAGRT